WSSCVDACVSVCAACVSCTYLTSCFFFFQAEDGIRDWSVTGVQTCALPIWGTALVDPLTRLPNARYLFVSFEEEVSRALHQKVRSEERRVGKECRSRWWPDH